MKKTTTGILTVCALIALCAVGSTTHLYAGSDAAAFASTELAVGGCENDVCINATSCQDGGTNLQCDMVGTKCNSNWCEATETLQ